MGIRRGGLTFTRYIVQGEPPRDMRQRFTRAVRAHVLAPLAPDDDAMETSGWCVLERPFDLDVNPTKLFEGAVLVVGLRVDRWRVPAPLLNAHLEEEEQALLARTGKKRLSRVERGELKQKIKLRLRRKTTPATRSFDVCWDLDGGTVLFFSHAPRVKETFTALFETTFGLSLAEDSPYMAAQRAELPRALERRLSTVEPTSLITRPTRAATSPESPDDGDDDASDDRDLVDRIETTRFLGPELLLWLWVRGELVGGPLSLPKSGEVEVWLDEQLALRSLIDPKESVAIRGMAPADGVEAREAVRAQKLPVAARVVARTREGDFSFVLKAPLLAMGTAGVPPIITDEDGDAFADRLDRIEQLMTVLDELFARFLLDRLSPVWADAWEPALAAWLDQRSPTADVLQKLPGKTPKGKRRGAR